MSSQMEEERGSSAPEGLVSKRRGPKGRRVEVAKLRTSLVS